MSNKDNLEQFFRERFDGAESPVNARVWESIRQSLPPEKEKKPMLRYFALTSVLLSICSIGTYFYVSSITGEQVSQQSRPNIAHVSSESELASLSNNTNAEIVDQKSVLHKVISPEASEVNREHATNSHKHLAITNVIYNHETFLNSDRNTDHAIDFYKQAHTSKKSNLDKGKGLMYSNDDTGTALTYGVVNDQLIFNSYLANTTDRNKLSGKDIPLIEEERLSLEVNQTSEQNQNIVDPTFESARTTSQNSFSNNSVDKVNSDGVTTTSASSSNQASVRGSNSSLPGPLVLKTSEKENKDSMVKRLDEKYVEEHDIKSEKKKKNRAPILIPTSIDAYLTPTFSASTLSGSASYLNDLKSNEKGRLAMGLGARVNFQVSKRWKVGTGVSYSSYGEKYTVKKHYSKELDHVNYNIYQDENLLWHYDPIDTIKFTKKFNTDYNRNNSYKFIGIPVLASYTLVDGKIGLAVTGGVAANFLVKASTSRLVFTSDSTTAVIYEPSKEANNSPFKPLVFSVFVSPGITYNVNDRLKLLIDPGFTWFTSSVYKKDYAVDRRIYALEVRAGVRFMLGR